MYLKRMELFGFKSFAEKSELNLSKGISAIIGPNGCGKSNIVDAVRWALGEQSVKSLRGLRMEEVIFSGSAERKPLNFAEVSLTFAGASDYLNLEYDEVTITRRLFRNGESEYLINKTPCRLKDITELFMDTGIGKEVYSVIGQGRVAEIVGSRPEERREIFEEAAGILKYKLRKKEARRRLDETRDNLIRIEDLVYELGTQVEPLTTQASVAREYKELQKRLDEEEEKLLSFKIFETESQLAKVNGQLESVNDALISAVAQRGLEEKALQDLKNNLHDHLELKKEEEQKSNQLLRTFEHQESTLVLLKEREGNLKEQLKQNETRMHALNEVLKSTEERTKAAAEDLQAKEEESKEEEDNLQKLRHDLQVFAQSAAAHEIERLQEDIYKQEARKEAASAALTEFNRRLKQLEEQAAGLKVVGQEQEEKLSKYQLALEDLHKEITAEQKVLHQAEESAKNNQKTKETLSSRLREAVLEEGKAKEKLGAATSRLNLLNEQEASLTGYYRGVKEVVRAGDSLPGIIGPVADLVKVDSKYVQAIETSLGSSMQYLVAAKEKDVRQAISYLKEHNKGWATFLPLDILRPSADPLKRYPGWQDLEGVIGRASDLVETDKDYRKATDYLLSSIMVCSNLEAASKAARFVSYSVKVVTLEGEMINPGGVMRGGSLPKRSLGQPLGRRKEIEELKEVVTALTLSYQATRELVLGTKEELEKLEKTAMEELTRGKKAESVLSELKRQLDRSGVEKEAAERFAASNLKSQQELALEESAVKDKLKNLSQEIEESALEMAKLKEELAASRSRYHQHLEEKTKLEQLVTDKLVLLSSFNEQKEALRQRIDELKTGLKKPTDEIAEITTMLINQKQALAENEKQQQQATLELESLNDQRAGLALSLERLTEKVSSLEAALIQSEEEERRRQNLLARREKRERQLSVEQTRLETEAGYQKARFKELYSDKELLVPEEGYDPDTGRLIMENYKEDLEALGEVNLGAIEELTRLQDRIGFLVDQKDDLLKGEVSLNKVLAEIDQRMEYYFMKAFEEINKHFKDTFRSLFQGGDVSLKLTDEKNILEAGIEIIAQPPGKKLQNITLFSGGEKVLIAIALVFAILRFKPAPFYLLDETESMLDDANLTRFTRFLKENARDAQFILITHRKRMMEEAEVLYGVTMPEPGVSRLLSVKLNENMVAREH